MAKTVRDDFSLVFDEYGRATGTYANPIIQDVIDKGGTPDVYKCQCLSCKRKMLELVDKCPGCGSVDVDYTPEYKLTLTKTTVSWDRKSDNELLESLKREAFDVSWEGVSPAGITPDDFVPHDEKRIKEMLNQMMIEELG